VIQLTFHTDKKNFGEEITVEIIGFCFTEKNDYKNIRKKNHDFVSQTVLGICGSFF